MTKRTKKAPEPPPVRLALRIEDKWWVAHMARTDTMEGAIEIGRILVNAATITPDLGDRWKGLMRDVLRDLLLALGAKPISWEETQAPPSERVGNA